MQRRLICFKLEPGCSNSNKRVEGKEMRETPTSSRNACKAREYGMHMNSSATLPSIGKDDVIGTLVRNAVQNSFGQPKNREKKQTPGIRT